MSPPIFDPQIKLIGRAVCDWWEVGFNASPLANLP